MEWVRLFLGAIPRLRTKIQLFGFIFLLVFAIYVNSKGVDPWATALVLATFIALVMALWAPEWMKTSSDKAKVTTLIAILLFAVVLLVLAFWARNPPSRYAHWAGHAPIGDLFDAIHRNDRTRFIFQAEAPLPSGPSAEATIRTLNLCPPTDDRFQGRNEYELVQDIVDHFASCLNATIDAPSKTITLRLMNGHATFQIADNGCYVCT